MDTKEAINRLRCALKQVEAALEEAYEAVADCAASMYENYHVSNVPPHDFLQKQLWLPQGPYNGLAAKKAPGVFSVGEDQEDLT